MFSRRTTQSTCVLQVHSGTEGHAYLSSPANVAVHRSASGKGYSVCVCPVSSLLERPLIMTVIMIMMVMMSGSPDCFLPSLGFDSLICVVSHP